ncbi:MAG TPA: Rieske 2Fe-2S domain-containing protein [Ktedonobacterales bacterium]|jgi:nitrite reductase/ring-hydroxylating ferredoxin subunit/uncharacterized membrane protein|nr:Rieske 2Fe-2S domain-containing protein [Ktedonobacterales bacterium]
MQATLENVERQDWVEQSSESVQQAVSSAYSAGGSLGQQVANFLNGTWLGHPLHPVVVAVPIGSWTATLALDSLELMGKKEMAAGADATVVVGLLGALSSAAAGLTQWQYTLDKPRRVGLLHGLVNVSATTLYAVSLLARFRGARRAGRLTALLGFGILTLGGYLGGELSYRYHIGIDHAPEEETPPSDFVAVLAEAELPEGTMKQVIAGTVPVLLARQGGQIYALANTCSHLGGPLAEGTLARGCVTCPWHGSQFALQDGRVLNGPATFPQPAYETRVWNGQIEVRAKSDAS